MKVKSKILSLESWPTQPFSYHPSDRLSPLTEKILLTTKIQQQEILPISIQEYAQLFQKEIDSKTNFISEYKQQLELRSRRVELLKSLWEKMNKKRAESSQRNTSMILSKKCRSPKNLVKFKEQSPTNSKKKKSKSPSPLIFKVTSKKKNLNLQYYNDFEYQRKHTSNTDQSTKSKQAITKTKNVKKSIIPNDDYFETKSKIKTRKDKTPKIQEESKQILVIELGNLMNKWSQLYEKHSKEENQSGNLTENERKRLEKMHEIQKKQLKTQIQQLSQKVYEKVHSEK